MTSRSVRIGAWAVAGVLGAGLATGVTWAAASGDTHSSHSGAAATATSKTHPRAKARGLLRRVEYGTLTVRGKGNTTTSVEVQKGTVTAASASSVSVRSRNGHTASYAITSASKIRANRARATISAVHTGDKVLVVGSGGDVRRLVDRKAGAAGTSAS